MSRIALITTSVATGDGAVSARYDITPDTGHYTKDVLVDGRSIGGQDYFDFNDPTGVHTIQATFAANEKSFVSPWGGPNARTMGVNYLNYLFVDCSKPWATADWLPLLRLLNIRMVMLTNWAVLGDYVPPAGALHNMKEVVTYFKANGIATMLYGFADLISATSTLAKDSRNYRRASDGRPLMAFGNYVPTPATSVLIADKLAAAYKLYGCDAGLFVDAIDYYLGHMMEPSTGVNFLRRVISKIIGSCPLDAASQLDGTGLAMYSRELGAAGDGNESHLRAIADTAAAWLIQGISQRVPFFGWLSVCPGMPYTVADLQYFLDKARSVGASVAIKELTPANYQDTSLAPYIDALKAFTTKWNPRVIVVQDAAGVPLAGVTVRVTDAAGGLVFEGTTTTGVSPGHDATAPGWVVCNLGASAGPYVVKTRYGGRMQFDTLALDSRDSIYKNTKITFTGPIQVG